MEVAIAVSKCLTTKKLYGIRFEKLQSNGWEFNWAFPIKAESAQREGYDKTVIKGTISQAEEYPGCPHCGSKGFFLCSCGKLNCWDGNKRMVTCSWCDRSGELSGSIESITVTGDM